MIITKLHIESFGTLHDLDLEFNDNLNQICKANGWGKSTLGVFLKAMFYGMSAKARGNAFNYERSKYMPWQGGNYGGFIEFMFQNQPYRLTRYFGKTPEGDYQELLNLTTMIVAPNPKSEIGEVVFGVGKETFEITAYFPQLNFLPTDNGEIKAELTGANKFQNDQANFERAIKIIESKISQTKKEIYKKEEIERTKMTLGENVAYQSLQKNNYDKLLGEVESQEGEIQAKEQLLNTSIAKNKFLQDKIDGKRELEGKIQYQTQSLSQVLLDKSAEEERNRLLSTGKKPILISTIITAVLTMAFGAVCLLNLLAGIVCVGMSLVFGLLVTIHFVKKRPKKIVSKRDYDGEIKYLSQSIDSLKKELKYFENESMEIEDNTPLIAQINALKVDNAIKLANIGNLEKEIARLENEEEEFNCLLTKMLENNEKITQKLNLLNRTKEFMLLAEENVSQRFIVPLNVKFKSLLEEFRVLDKDFVVDSNLSVKQNTIYGQKELEYSSQGLQDILSFCQRINLATQTFNKEKPFIVLDDTFVNLDDEKLEIAKKIVHMLSKDYQIIYICCNSRNRIEE